MDRMRIATAVLVTRGAGREVEVLAVRRNPSLRFFGGYWAFPGGVVDDADHDGEADVDPAHVRCAVRELVEEVGWHAQSSVGGLREGLMQRDAAEAAAAFRLQVDAEPELLFGVRPFARLTTPPFAPVRYRTRFCHVEAPANFEPVIIEGELVDGGFWRPDALLDAWRKGELLVAPPVVFMLEHLAELGLEEFMARIPAMAEELEKGKLHPIRNVPGIVMAPLATETLPPATTTNAYFVGEERFFVVDPAPAQPSEQRRLFDLIDEWTQRGADFVGVLLTHHHPDHVGAVDATAARYDVPVLAHPATFDRLDLAAENQRAIADGVELPLGTAPDGSPGWTLTAHHTPGHAPGHLVFLESRYGAMIAGDLVSTVSTIVIDPPEGHLASYLDSLQRMADAAGDHCVLHPSHGPVATDARALLLRYVEHRGRREESLVNALADGITDEGALVRRVYADVPDELHPIAARSLRAGLEKLADEGRASEFEPGAWRP